MEVRGITGVAAFGFGVPPCNSTSRAFSIKFFKFHSGFENAPHVDPVTSQKTNYFKVQPMFWGREFQSRQEHANTASPYKWPYKHASSLVFGSVSYYQRNDVGDIESVEKKIRKDLKLPVSSEVESLITTICDTTSIAEFKLNLAGFNLYIKRNLVEENRPMHAASSQISISAPAPASNGSASCTSLAVSKSKPSSEGRILDTATDEGLVILQSPKVGYFRRSRKIKGKRAPPSCKEDQVSGKMILKGPKVGRLFPLLLPPSPAYNHIACNAIQCDTRKQVVKEGQVLCYIEQLGGEIPIESDISGEVIKILRKDGEPVGYGDALIVILPSFPGIKMHQ